MSKDREFVHPGDDAAFVRRCRIVAVAMLRVCAIYLVWKGLAGLGGTIVSMTPYTSFGAAPTLSFLSVLILTAPVVYGVAVWIGAGWISRRLLPMPPARSQCPRCKYPIADLDGDTCPECGARVR